MDLLRHYVVMNQHISEWQLWDNCRNPADRAYIESLAREHEKIRVLRLGDGDGTNRSINQYYHLCNDPGAFYIKMDDDIVYVEQGMPEALLDAALAGRSKYLWWSPLVINNAICSWLLLHHGRLESSASLSAQASCSTGWRDPYFARMLHGAFLSAVSRGERVDIPDAYISNSRFSINCIGFFGEDVKSLGAAFCPGDVDDEEWLSAILPLRQGLAGCVVGATCVAHYSFFTQESVLNASDVLDRYYDLAKIKRRYAPALTRRVPLAQKLKRIARAILNEVGLQTARGKRVERTLRFNTTSHAVCGEQASPRSPRGKQELRARRSGTNDA